MTTPTDVEPVFSQATEDAYARLPDVYRATDAPGGWPLKRFISGLFDQVGEMRALRERLALDPEPNRDRRPSGDTVLVQAEQAARVGPWEQRPGLDPTATVLSTDGPQAASLEQEVFVTGGRYRLTVSYDATPDGGILIAGVDQRTRTLDTYNATPAAMTGQPLFTDLDLPRGYHTLRLAWTGDSRPEATGSRVTVDRLRLTNLLGPERDVSDLVDPSAADDQWLDWLAQLVGTTLEPGLTRIQRRDAIRAAGAFNAGSKQAVADAARTVLSGTQRVRVIPHSRTSSGPNGEQRAAGDEWDLLLVTRSSETPSSEAVIRAVMVRQAKPAGTVLHHLTYQAVWATVHREFPTWAAIHEARTWARVEEAGL